VLGEDLQTLAVLRNHATPDSADPLATNLGVRDVVQRNKDDLPRRLPATGAPAGSARKSASEPAVIIGSIETPSTRTANIPSRRAPRACAEPSSSASAFSRTHEPRNPLTSA
jgi:hypothetical protein